MTDEEMREMCVSTDLDWGGILIGGFLCALPVLLAIVVVFIEFSKRMP